MICTCPIDHRIECPNREVNLYMTINMHEVAIREMAKEIQELKAWREKQKS